jgi:hypothetical protein
MQKNYDYWRFPEKGFPKTVHWKVVTPAYHKDGSLKGLSRIQRYDLLFDMDDLRRRRLV